MRVKNHALLVLLVFLTLVWTGCERKERMEEIIPVDTGREITSAIAVLYPTEGNSVRGQVIFTQVEGGIRINAYVEGLSPGKHGFHIHELGDCSAPDGSSAGGHFNPDSMPHGGPYDASRHAGDLGNLVAGEDGIARYERVDFQISFSGEHSIIGLAAVVHAGEDDFTTQPSGDSGPRVACGVIGIDDEI